jgi:hypothetical protein
MQPTNDVSALFVHLLQPIFDLFELLEHSNPKGPNVADLFVSLVASPILRGSILIFRDASASR